MAFSIVMVSLFSAGDGSWTAAALGQWAALGGVPGRLPVWLPVLLFLSGFLMADGTISSVWRRPVRRQFLRQWHRPAWLLLAEVLVGALGMVGAAILWPFSDFVVETAIIAGCFVVIALMGSLRLFIADSRSAAKGRSG